MPPPRPSSRVRYTLLPDAPPTHSTPIPMPPTNHPASALERKTALISAALDQTGMGRYQWSIFFLCGFGYALDLMWAQAFSLVTPRIQQELGIADKDYGDIFSVFSAGLTIGAFVWGLLVDIIGRRWAFNLTVGIVAAFGLILGALNSWRAICAVVFFIGFGLGGNIPIDATIVLEFLPNDRRYLLAALSVFQPIGVIVTSLLSWALVPRYACAADLPACAHISPSPSAPTPAADVCCTKRANYGWRYALFALGALSVLAFVARFALFRFYESPRFLVGKGRDAEAVWVVRQVARVNGVSVHVDVGDLEAVGREGFGGEGGGADLGEVAGEAEGEASGSEAVAGKGKGKEKDSSKAKGNVEVDIEEVAVGSSGDVDVETALEKSKMGKPRTEAVLSVESTGFAMVGHLRGLFATRAMVRLTVLTWVCYAADYWGFVIAGNFLPKFLADRGAAADESVYDTYRNYIVIAVAGVPGVLLGAALIEVPRVGRKWAMVLSSAAMGASLFLYAAVTTPAASVGFNAMEYFFQSTFNAVLYGWTPEAFPAAVRGSACGLASFWGRLASVVAPLVAARLGTSEGVVWLAGAGVFVCTVCALWLPETRGGGAA